MYFGGDSDSQANTTSNTTNTNHITTEDRRVVASDAAVAVSGNGNSTSRTESTSFADSSNRSTNFADSSTRDSGNSTNITNTTTDFGAISKGMEGITTMGIAAVDLGDTSVTGAIQVLKNISDNNRAVTMKAFDMANDNSQSVMNFAGRNTESVKDAFQTATIGPDENKTVLLAALAVIGAVGAAWAFKKG
jgi:hypothetical protein